MATRQAGEGEDVSSVTPPLPAQRHEAGSKHKASIQGRARGGYARAAALSPLQRVEIARMGALARWGSKAKA